MINIWFSAKPAAWGEYRGPLQAAFADTGIDVALATDHAPETVDYIVFASNGPVTDFTPYMNTKGILSLWARVETVVDDSLTSGMVEWVVGHAMRHHLGMDTHITGQDGVWRDTVFPPLARSAVRR